MQYELLTSSAIYKFEFNHAVITCSLSGSVTVHMYIVCCVGYEFNFIEENRMIRFNLLKREKRNESKELEFWVSLSHTSS